jgi:alkanesulfonate monooxygenase SsuD/methylene tetrahydromethanopterin reductase-like flavin-dependent oxidoreductase (luciferase family)
MESLRGRMLASGTGVDLAARSGDNVAMSKPSKEQVRKYYRTQLIAMQAGFEGYTTAQRAKLMAENCQVPDKKRASLLKKLEKDEKSVEKAFRRALKEIDKT